MSITPNIEEATLPKCSSPRTLPHSGVRAGHYQYERLRNLHSGGKGKTPSSVKFSIAFSKALRVRSRNLGRNLNRLEWIALKVAVLRQMRRNTDKLSLQLKELQRQINEVKKLTPVSLQGLDDSINIMASQMQILRRQLCFTIQESDDVSETCPHFKNRVLYTLPVSTEVLYYRPKGLVDLISLTLDGKTIQLCCDKCLARREDFYFTLTGEDLPITKTIFSTFDLGESSMVELSKIPLLSIQSVWTSVVNLFLRSKIN